MRTTGLGVMKSYTTKNTSRARRVAPKQNPSAHADSCDFGRQCTQHSPERCDFDGRCQPPPTTGARTAVHARRGSEPLQRCAIHRLPPEILDIIYECCLDEQAAFSETPLLLGQVCGYWRSASQSNRRLWASLSLAFLETDVDRSRDGVKVANAVETWLVRSYPDPLSLTFTDNRIFQKDTEDVVIWLLSCVRAHAPRWKAIHLKFSSDYFVQLPLLSACAFTALTSFAVHVDHMGWRRSLLSFSLDLLQATRLTELAYTGPDHIVREDIWVGWARLTSLAFSYDLHESAGHTATLPRHFATLALCQNLAELSIGLSTTLGQHTQPLDVLTPGQVIELPKLQTLRVRRLSRSGHACSLIDALRLPELSTLDIDGALLAGWEGSHAPPSHTDISSSQLQAQAHTQTHWWHATHFSALLDRSACHLHTLCIRNVDISPFELGRLLTSPSTSPTLTTFTFEPFPRTYLISDVLVHLTSAPASGSTTSEPSPSLTPSSSPSLSLSPSPSPSPSSNSSPSPTCVSGSAPLPFPCLTRLRLSCAHETHLDSLADVIEARTGDRAARAGVRPLAVFELVFYDFMYSHGYGRGRQPWRKLCFDAFRERVLRCAREGGVDVDIEVQRPYEPAYLSTP